MGVVNMREIKMNWYIIVKSGLIHQSDSPIDCLCGIGAMCAREHAVPSLYALPNFPIIRIFNLSVQFVLPRSHRISTLRINRLRLGQV